MSLELAKDLYSVVLALLLLGFGVHWLVKGTWWMALAFFGVALGRTDLFSLLIISGICLLAALFLFFRRDPQPPSKGA
jgi:hypothetical protein